MYKFILRVFLVLAFILSPLNISTNNPFNISYSVAQAQSEQEDIFPAKPKNNIYVVDTANLFNSETKSKLVTDSHKLSQEYNTQVVVVTINSLKGLSIEEYTNQLFRKWGIGDKKENSGVLILISKDDHKARIEVGYGIEGIINDGKAGRILKNMLAEFKKDNYNEGILKAHKEITNEISSNKDKVEKKQQTEPSDGEIFLLLFVFGFIFFALIFFIKRDLKRRKRNYKNGNSSDSSFWDYFFISSMSDDINNNSHKNNSDDDDDDHWFSGGGSSDSDFFDSFGGGDSGGGGSSDDW